MLKHIFLLKAKLLTVIHSVLLDILLEWNSKAVFLYMAMRLTLPQMRWILSNLLLQEVTEYVLSLFHLAGFPYYDPPCNITIFLSDFFFSNLISDLLCFSTL